MQISKHHKIVQCGFANKFSTFINSNSNQQSQNSSIVTSISKSHSKFLNSLNSSKRVPQFIFGHNFSTSTTPETAQLKTVQEGKLTFAYY